MPSPFQAAGGATRPTPYVPLFTDTFFTGLWTQRNPLRDAATPFLYRKFYGATRYDSLIDGLNTEVSSRLTLVRRPGVSVYNGNIFPPINRFYEFRQFGTGTQSTRIIADTGNTGGVIYDATGPSTQIPIFTKSAGASDAYFQAIGDILYFGDGVDQKKYIQGPTGWVVQNWGIAPASGFGGGSGPSTIGPNPPTSGTNGGGSGQPWQNPNGVISSVASVNTSQVQPPVTGTASVGSGTNWNNPQFVQNQGDQYAYWYAPPNASGVSTPLSGTGFGFSIPGNATIVGLIAQFNVFTPHLKAQTAAVQLLSGGSPLGAPKAGTRMWTPSGFRESYGSPTDLWSASLTPAMVNNSSFGFSVAGSFTNPMGNFQEMDLAFYSLTVYYYLGSGQPFSQTLQATGFNFNVPMAEVVSGIGLNFNASGTGATLQVQLLANGSPIGNPKTITNLPGVLAPFALGGDGDDWGVVNLSPSLISTSGFGVGFTVVSGAAHTQINGATLTVLSSGAPTAVPVGAGTFSAQFGYKYVYSYVNSLDGGYSTASPPSSSTGAFSNAQGVDVQVVMSPDPQVTAIQLFRTADGGGTYFELPFVTPNVTGTVLDSTPDNQLLPITAPLNHYNDPPPQGLIVPTFHSGRMWGAVGNIVYYTRAQDPLTAGNSVESWPPANNFVMPNKVTRFIPTVYGLLVFLVSDTWLITGDGSSGNPFDPVPFIPGMGFATYDAMSNNGALIYGITSDGQGVSIDPNAGVTEVGFPIGDILETSEFNNSGTSVTYHNGGSSDKGLYVGGNAGSWFRYSQVAAPETGSLWAPRATITQGFSALQSVDIGNGTRALLLGPKASGPILQRNLKMPSDNGVAYPAYATFGNITLAQHGQLAELGFVASDYKSVVAGGNIPQFSALMDDVNQPFLSLPNFVNDPPNLPPSVNLPGSRWYFSQSKAPAWCRHLQIKITLPTTSTFDEIYSYSLYGRHWNER